MKSLLLPSPLAAEQQAYSVPKHPAPIDLRLDANEGRLLSAALVDVGSPGVLSQYPSRASLQEALANRFKVAPEQVIITAGGDEAIERACRAVLAPGRELILPVPTFEMIGRNARAVGAEVRRVPWESARFPLQKILAEINPATAMIAVVSPNNPTGWVASKEDLRTLSTAAPKAMILLDAAYGEFAAEDLTSLGLELPNVIVIRTFSKAWGLAGLRVGYALGPVEPISWMNAVRAPSPTASLSLQITESHLRERENEMRRVVGVVSAEREALEELLLELGATLKPSQANFVLAQFEDREWIWNGLAGFGISVRKFPGNPELESSLRISCPGNEKEFARLTHALRSILAPEALLFELGGGLQKTLFGFPERLNSLAKQLLLGIVTDCPRKDAEAFLESQGIRKYFAELVCLEDAAPRPDPASVKLLCTRLGVERAWLVGDTPDAVLAARGAAVLPLGFLTEEHRTPQIIKALSVAGAASVLVDLRQLEEAVL